MEMFLCNDPGAAPQPQHRVNVDNDMEGNGPLTLNIN